MTNAPIVFLDTETDGVHPGRKVWEVAMIRREPDGRQRETRVFVDIDLSTSDPFGLKVGRFYDRHPLGRELSGLDYRKLEAVSPAEAARLVAQWTHGAHIVGAVPNFDTEVLGNLLRAHGLTPAWHYHLIDVEALAIGWLNGVAAHGHSSIACSDSPIDCDRDTMPLALPWKSEDLSRACGIEPPAEDERHTAMGDARWAMRIYDKITGGAE